MALDAIRVVAGDEFPAVTLTLTDENTGAAIDLSAGTTSVSIKFRLAGTLTTLSTISAAKTGDGSGGIVSFNFTGGVLNVDAGAYEGDILISFNGDIQTVFDVLRFRVRDAAT